MKRVLFDIETDGLLDTCTKVHCIATIDVDTGGRASYLPHEINVALYELGTADVLIGHNIQRFDLKALKKLYGFKTGARVLDTMLIARLQYPNVKETDVKLVLTGQMPPGREYQGKHTLAAWGYRLGEHKGDYGKLREAKARELGLTSPEDIERFVWGEWSQEMQDYTVQDCETNLALWRYLNVDKYSTSAINLEHRIATLCDHMENAGVPFDIEGARKLHVALSQRADAIERELVDTFGSWEAPIRPDPKKSWFVPKRDNARRGYKAGVGFTKMKKVVFNPKSRDHIAKVLLDRGWKPEKLTDGGKPQIDEEVVTTAAMIYPETEGLAEYLMVQKRLSQLAMGDTAWLQMVKPDGNIHGVINPMGTTTSRASHFLPNLAQVPNGASPYGPECRALFHARPGWVMVGADMSGLELRGLAHYLHPMDGGAYASAVLEGDIHWTNAQAMGLIDVPRDKHNKLHTIIREDGSKRFIYAYIYGCGDLMAGQIIFGTVDKARKECGAEGQALYDRFFPEGYSEKRARYIGGKVRRDFAAKIEGFTGLRNKLDRLVSEYGWLPGLDGRRVPVRSAHSALNFVIQSSGAIICKNWACNSFDQLSSVHRFDQDNPWNGDFAFGLWVHDELQVWCRESIAEDVAAVMKEQASKAGEPYGFRVRLDGSAKIGRTWAETH